MINNVNLPIFISPVEDKSIRIGIKPGIGIGKGRVEDVTDSWHTIRILKDLERENLLTNIPDHQQIMTIAKRISEIKFDFPYDNRIRTKSNLKSLDETLFNSGLIKERNIDYFNSIQDMWFFGADFRRLTNWETGINLYPYYSYWNGDLEKDLNKGYSYGIISSLYFNNYKPVNMFWQFDYHIGLDFDYNKYNYELGQSYSSLVSNLDMAPNISADLKYFISTRAYFLTTLYSSIAYRVYSEYSDYNYFSFNIVSYNKLVYYISQKTNFSMNLNLNYSKFENNGNSYNYHSSGFNHSFNFGLHHYIY